MIELIIGMSKVIGFEGLLPLLEEAIKEYKADPTDRNKNRVVMHCAMVATSEVAPLEGKTGDKMADTFKVLEELKKMTAARQDANSEKEKS